MKVSLSRLSNLCTLYLVTLYDVNVGDVKPRRALPKGKSVTTNGDLSVYSLLKMNSVIGRRFWLKKFHICYLSIWLLALFWWFIFLARTCFVVLVCNWIAYLYCISMEMNNMFIWQKKKWTRRSRKTSATFCTSPTPNKIDPKKNPNKKKQKMNLL